MKLGIYTHQGLGDQIECCGMIRAIKKVYSSYDEICIATKQRYADCVNFMYRDDPSVKIYEMPSSCNDNGYNEKIWVRNNMLSSMDFRIVPGHENYNPSQFKAKGMCACKAFYAIAGIDYSHKFTDFYFQRDVENEDRVYKKLVPAEEKYVFVHDDPSRGYKLNIDTKYKIVRNDKTENIFHMIKVLEHAEEIHCMSSSFLGLIDCVSASPLMGTKLNNIPKFLHWNIRKVYLSEGFFGALNWNILK